MYSRDLTSSASLEIGEDRLQLCFPYILQVLQVDVFAVDVDDVIHGGGTEEFTGRSIQKLQNNCAIAGLEQVVQVDIAAQGQAYVGCRRTS